jgi:hypothetical protein
LHDPKKGRKNVVKTWLPPKLNVVVCKPTEKLVQDAITADLRGFLSLVMAKYLAKKSLGIVILGCERPNQAKYPVLKLFNYFVFNEA